MTCKYCECSRRQEIIIEERGRLPYRPLCGARCGGMVISLRRDGYYLTSLDQIYEAPISFCPWCGEVLTISE